MLSKFQNGKIGDLFSSEMAELLSLYSMEGCEIIHSPKDSNPTLKNKINLAYCANCGRPAKYGMFCSESCERELYGV